MFSFLRKNQFPTTTAQFASKLRPMVIEPATNLVRIEESGRLTLGFGLRMEPVFYPDLDADERVAQALGGLPEGALVQFSVLSTPQVKPVLDDWLEARARGGPETLQQMAQARHQMMLDAAAGRSLIPRQQLMPCVRHHFVFVQIPCDVRNCSPLERDAFARIVEKIQYEFVGALRVAGIQTSPMKAANYHALWTELLNQQCSPGARLEHIRKAESFIAEKRSYPVLQHAVVGDTQVARGPAQGLLFGAGTNERAVAALTISGHRRFFVGPRTSNGYPRLFSGYGMATVTGNPLSYEDRISVPYWVYTNIEILEQREANRALQGRSAAHRRNIRNRFPLQGHDSQNECQVTLAHLKGYKFVRISTGMNLYAPPTEIEREMKHAAGLWHRAGFRVRPHSRREDPVIERSWPFQCVPQNAVPWRSHMHAELMSTYNAAAFTFIQGSSAGLEPKQGGALMVDRRGQVATFTPWSPRHLNRNFVIAGMAGSGKHFFAMELVADALAAGASVHVLGATARLAAPCQALGGKLFEVSAQKPFSLNPFIGVNPDDARSELRDLIVWLFDLLYPEVEPSRLSEGMHRLLETGLLEVFAARGNAMELRDLHDWLVLHPDEWHAPELAARLEPFVSGAYAKWFQGPCGVGADCTLAFANFEEVVRDDKELCGYLCSTLLYLVTRQITRGHGRKPSLILMDAQLLQDQARNGMLMEKLMRRAPMYNTGFGILVEDFDAMHRHAAQRVMVENSASYIFAGQGCLPEQLPEHERYTLHTLRDGMGFSELYIRENNQEGQSQGLYRFIVDSLTHQLFSGDNPTTP